jgi:hypothetical protein
LTRNDFNSTSVHQIPSFFLFFSFYLWSVLLSTTIKLNFEFLSIDFPFTFEFMTKTQRHKDMPCNGGSLLSVNLIFLLPSGGSCCMHERKLLSDKVEPSKICDKDIRVFTAAIMSREIHWLQWQSLLRWYLLNYQLLGDPGYPNLSSNARVSQRWGLSNYSSILTRAECMNLFPVLHLFQGSKYQLSSRHVSAVHPLPDQDAFLVLDTVPHV